jgi:beta-lactamase class A
MFGAVLGTGISIYILSQNDPVAFFNGDCIKQYPLTNRVLDCDTYDATSAKLQELNQDLDDLEDSYISQGKATRISIWVRDLTTLQWAAVNETERYAPASLFKTPVMIAYFKLAEGNPSILNEKLTFTPSTVLNSNTQDFAPSNKLRAGESYTVEELIGQMIINSDNDAAATLLTHISPAVFENTLVELGIKIPDNNENIDFITVKSFGAIFRSLYNASYLDRKYSQKALDILSKTEFRGMAELLPKDLIVAHKFGERIAEDQITGTEIYYLHDCGIVYKETHPYTLCIMTEGKDFSSLTSIIQNISYIVYNNL